VQYALFVGGTNGSDTIEVRRGSSPTSFNVVMNGLDKGQFSAPAGSFIGAIFVYGNGGDDSITVNTNLGALPVALYGGAGNDILRGGAGNSLLDGGDGNDQLIGTGVEDFLFGRAGADTLSGG